MEVLFLFAGVVLGSLLNYIFIKGRNDGTLEIDNTNPNQPYHRLLMSNEQFSRVPKKKIVILKVNSNAHFTRFFA